MKTCERCKATSSSPGAALFETMDYCAACSRDLCDACMEKGCCGVVPAKSGIEADFPEDDDDGCCPGCGACPGFIGADCDGDCGWGV